MDANTFHEGFAHLLSYGSTEITEVNWHDERLERAYSSGKVRMRAALAETDAEKQNKYLLDAVCGSYYEKFGLKRQSENWHGFAAALAVMLIYTYGVLAAQYPIYTLLFLLDFSIMFGLSTWAEFGGRRRILRKWDAERLHR